MKALVLALGAVVLAACQTSKPTVTTVPSVDLKRFMGDWYVIACIPTFIEKNAFNAVESYRLDSDGSIDTLFTLNQGSFSGPKKTYNPRGFVLDATSNAVWGMRFIWPIKADYRIVYLNADYSQTIIARNARDYVWIMARTPTIADADYVHLIQQVQRIGYDITQMRKVPQQSIEDRQHATR